MLDLTFGPSFKVKRWFTGFGELSFWWIQIFSSVVWMFFIPSASDFYKYNMQLTHYFYTV